MLCEGRTSSITVNRPCIVRPRDPAIAVERGIPSMALAALAVTSNVAGWLFASVSAVSAKLTLAEI